MKNYITALLISAASILPACSSKGNAPSAPPASITGLTNVRTTIEDLLTAGEPIQIVIPTSYTQDEFDSAQDVYWRLDDEMKQRHSSSLQLFTGILAKGITNDNFSTFHRIYIGTETDNPSIARFRSTLTDTQERILPGNGIGVVEAYAFSNSKKAIIITGTNDGEIHNAGQAVTQYDWPDLRGNTIDLDGTIIHVNGAFSDVSTTVYRK